MTSNDFTQLMYCFIMLSVLLLIGTALRAVVPFFQKVFLPASRPRSAELTETANRSSDFSRNMMRCQT